jgi:hypothetical protein
MPRSIHVHLERSPSGDWSEEPDSPPPHTKLEGGICGTHDDVDIVLFKRLLDPFCSTDGSYLREQRVAFRNVEVVA